MTKRSLSVVSFVLNSSYPASKTPVAREKIHYAATIAGMAFANEMLGHYKLSETQADAILNLQLVRLTNMEREKIHNEFLDGQFRVIEKIQKRRECS